MLRTTAFAFAIFCVIFDNEHNIWHPEHIHFLKINYIIAIFLKFQSELSSGMFVIQKALQCNVQNIYIAETGYEKERWGDGGLHCIADKPVNVDVKSQTK